MAESQSSQGKKDRWMDELAKWMEAQMDGLGPNRRMYGKRYGKRYECMNVFMTVVMARNSNLSNFVSKAPDKSGIQINIFLLLHKNICCGYSLEVPWHF